VGLSVAETEVLGVLLQNAEGQRASSLARKTGLNRTTLYGLLKSLAQKGLVSYIEERSIQRYRSVQPRLLIDYIDRVKDKLSADAERIQQLLPLLETERTKMSRAYPSIQFFEGKEGIKQVYEDTIDGNISKALYGFLGAEAGYKFMGLDWANYYIEKRSKRGIKYFNIGADTPQTRVLKSQDKNELRVTKLLPPGYDFDIEITAYDDKLLVVSFAEDHPLAVLIEDQKIADTIKTLFRYIDSTLAE
jgi:sugar-specific transcriptional regulator TrmB